MRPLQISRRSPLDMIKAEYCNAQIKEKNVYYKVSKKDILLKDKFI